jgi:hypothetical protein
MRLGNFLMLLLIQAEASGRADDEMNGIIRGCHFEKDLTDGPIFLQLPRSGLGQDRKKEKCFHRLITLLDGGARLIKDGGDLIKQGSKRKSGFNETALREGKNWMGTSSRVCWGFRGEVGHGSIRRKNTKRGGVIVIRVHFGRTFPPIVTEVLNDGVLRRKNVIAVRAAMQTQVCEVYLLIITGVMTCADVKAKLHCRRKRLDCGFLGEALADAAADARGG